MRSGAIRRFGSYFVDNIVLSILQLPFLGLVNGRVSNFVDLAYDLENNLISESYFMEQYIDFMIYILKFSLLFALTVMVVYYAIVPLFWKGKTIGRVVCGCYVQTTDGSELTFSRLFVREVIFKLLWWTLTLGIGSIIDFLMVALREDKKTIRDIITKTEIVESEGESVKKEYYDF
ncbi:RDD family protein [Mycoplasmatota bacterium WC44]